MQNAKPFGLKRNLEYLKQGFLIQLKYTKEYKANVLLGFIANLTFMLTIVIFLAVLNTQFSQFINWDKKSFIFYFIFMEMIVMITHPLFNIRLKGLILNGELNKYLYRPLNSFIQYFLDSSHFFTLYISFFYFLLLVLFLIFIYPEFNLIKLLLVFIFGLCGGIFFISIIVLINALSFFMKNSIIFERVFRRTEGMFYYYPINFFEKSNFYYLLSLLPIAYFGVFSTNYFFGFISNIEFLLLFVKLFLSELILITGISLLWHYGLKKYEAFG